MEREKELVKLINVLRRTSRMALQSEWTGGKEDAASFCTEQYNRVLALGGGLPVKAGNEVVGAVGVSGSPGKDDVCSQAGIDKVADQLK